MTRFAPQHQLSELYRTAKTQGDVIATHQLYGLGCSFEEIRAMVRRGVLHRIHQGVYAVGLPEPTPYGRLHAALLVGGPRSFLSHRSAPPEWSLWRRYAREIHLTVPGTSARRSRNGLIFHRTTDVSGVVTRNGLRVSCLERLLIELSRPRRWARSPA